MRPLLLLALLMPALATAQTPGTCARGAATARLNAGDVDATLYNGGNLFQGPTASSQYVVPRVSGGTALYAAGLWVGATVGGEPRVASASFEADFWPGPLNAGAALPNPANCSAYDRIYVVTAAEVAAYEAGAAPAADLAAWPVGLGAEARNAAGRLVVPTSRGQIINLASGERPVVLGGQTAFWVMNDVGYAHTRSGSAPLGIEVQVTASAFVSGPTALRQSTAYRFRIVNRNTVALDSAFVSFFVDTNIGTDIPNQRQGVDLPRGMAFTYNRNPTATPYGISPAVGYDFLNTGVGAHRYALNGSAAGTSDPSTTQGIYNTMRGLWNDGTPQLAFGSGYGQTQGAVTRYAFPADPVTAQFWSGENTNGQGGTALGGNSRSIASTPGFRLAPGASADVAIAVLFAQGADRLDSVTRLRAASDLVQAAYDAGTLLPTAADVPPTSVGMAELGEPVPNPARGTLAVDVSMPVAGRLRIVDVLGRTVAEQPLSAGTQTVRLDTQRLAPGAYALVLDAGTARATRTVTVVR